MSPVAASLVSYVQRSPTRTAPGWDVWAAESPDRRMKPKPMAAISCTAHFGAPTDCVSERGICSNFLLASGLSRILRQLLAGGVPQSSLKAGLGCPLHPTVNGRGIPHDVCHYRRLGLIHRIYLPQLVLKAKGVEFSGSRRHALLPHHFHGVRGPHGGAGLDVSQSAVAAPLLANVQRRSDQSERGLLPKGAVVDKTPIEVVYDRVRPVLASRED